MTELFKRCVKVVFKHEGGFSDHPSDPGGATNYGISLRFLKGIDPQVADIDDDGDVDYEDIVAMEIEDAEKLYWMFFWKRAYDKMIPELALNVFDFGVNAGVRTAIKALQRVLGVDVDGIIGNITLRAIDDYEGNIVEDYKEERMGYYKNLTVRKPTLKVFLGGWTNRVNSCKL